MSAEEPKQLRVCVLASGSSGNCSYVGDGTTGLLIDAGISSKQILARLSDAGLGSAPIDAVLLTHEHRDHVQGARVLAKRLERRTGRSTPFLATSGTLEGIPTEHRPTGLATMNHEGPTRLGDFLVQPFSIPHDTHQPVGFRVEIDGWRLAFATDLGRPTSAVEAHMADVDVAIIEFNHEVNMLLEGRYPWWLKQRVLSSHGHLSNDQAATLIERIASPRLRHVFLAHLSMENNRPARALAAAHAALARSTASQEVQVTVASQTHPSPVVTLESA